MRPRVFALAFGAMACAAPQRAPETPASAQPGGETGLASDAVLVLPVQGFQAQDTTFAPAQVLALIAAFESSLQDSLTNVVVRTWVWPAQVRALHRRNPLSMPHPQRLGLEAFLPTARAGSTLPQDAATNVRRLLSLSGARRHVVVPFAVGVHRREGLTASARIAIIDSRLADVTAIHSVTSGRRSTAESALAALAVSIRRLFVAD